MKKFLVALFIFIPAVGWATCPTPLTVKDAAGTTQNLSTTDDSSGNCQTNTLSKPGLLTPVTLDIKTVTTGGTAVTAISAGHRTGGGFLKNPENATIFLCINEIGTAAGTISSGDTTCIGPGIGYNVAPGSGAVSVITSDSAHPFSGFGLTP